MRLKTILIKDHINIPGNQAWKKQKSKKVKHSTHSYINNYMDKILIENKTQKEIDNSFCSTGNAQMEPMPIINHRKCPISLFKYFSKFLISSFVDFSKFLKSSFVAKWCKESFRTFTCDSACCSVNPAARKFLYVCKVLMCSIVSPLKNYLDFIKSLTSWRTSFMSLDNIETSFERYQSSLAIPPKTNIIKLIAKYAILLLKNSCFISFTFVINEFSRIFVNSRAVFSSKPLARYCSYTFKVSICDIVSPLLLVKSVFLYLLHSLPHLNYTFNIDDVREYTHAT